VPRTGYSRPVREPAYAGGPADAPMSADPPATQPVQQPFPPKGPPMLGAPGAWSADVPAHPFLLWDYVPAAVVAVVLLAFAVTLVVVATHQHHGSEERTPKAR